MPETPEKRKILPVIAIIAAILIFVVVVVGIAMSRLSSQTATKTTNSASSDTASKSTKETSIAQKPALPKEKQSADDKVKYEGWQTYDNKTWKVFARYPAVWTMTETTGSLRVTFLGPLMATPGVILNECSFSIFVTDVTAGTLLEDYVAAARAEPMGGGGVVTETETSIGESTGFKVIDTYADVGAPWKRMRVWTVKDTKAYTFTYVASTNYATIDYYTIHSGEADMIMASVSLD